MNNLFQNIKRECGNCTECCQGWLRGEAHGKPFYPGRPCHFVCEVGCSIYKDRPFDPCVQFRCEWLEDANSFPEWMKPSLSKVIITARQTKNKISYYEVVECGQKIDSVVLNYLILHTLRNNLNLRIQVNGAFANYGSPHFLRDIN